MANQFDKGKKDFTNNKPQPPARTAPDKPKKDWEAGWNTEKNKPKNK